MYIFLIIVHSLFIFFAHIFGYFLLEGVFILLLLFFLLYFSPIFFFKKNTEMMTDLFSFELSPQKSLIIPLILSYVGIYILAFTFSGELHQSIAVHIMIFLAIFTILIGYIFSFSWKNDIFFDITRFHLLFSYLTLFIIGFFYYFNREFISGLDVLFIAVVLLFSIFFFLHEKKMYKGIFQFFLLAVLFASEILILYFFPESTLYFLVGMLVFVAIFLFEYGKKTNFFGPFLQESRIFFLSSVLFFSIILVGIAFFSIKSLYFLIPAIVFLFSVHIRFSNLIAYGSAIFFMYSIYYFLFFTLISPENIFSTLIFIFFFPAAIIINTYFWKERYSYDFAMLHYSSIGFSIIFFLYSFFAISWGESTMIFTSFSVFLLAILFTLFYFRFRIK